ncbi:MAG: DUF3291 domain-containing protein [Psychroflexus sp.]
MPQIATLSVFNYEGFQNKFWALSMMQFGHAQMKSVEGLQFYKLLGSGKAHFNPLPDWRVYAILQVWDSFSDFENFKQKHPLFQKYKSHAEHIKIYVLQNIQTRGLWNGKNPFESVISSKSIQNEDQIAVITRASIKKRMLRRFWKYVPESQKPLENAKGLLYTKGFGELPFVEMMTFSVWDSVQKLNDFAYQSREHVKAIKKTRELDWYHEEMFARFKLTELLEI